MLNMIRCYRFSILAVLESLNGYCTYENLKYLVNLIKLYKINQNKM